MINREFGISKYKLPYTTRINNKVLPYSTGSYVQYPVINYNGKECGKEATHTHIYLCCTPETNNMVNQLFSNIKLKVKKHKSPQIHSLIKWIMIRFLKISSMYFNINQS